MPHMMNVALAAVIEVRDVGTYGIENRGGCILGAYLCIEKLL